MPIGSLSNIPQLGVFPVWGVDACGWGARHINSARYLMCSRAFGCLMLPWGPWGLFWDVSICNKAESIYPTSDIRSWDHQIVSSNNITTMKSTEATKQDQAFCLLVSCWAILGDFWGQRWNLFHGRQSWSCPCHGRGVKILVPWWRSPGSTT